MAVKEAYKIPTSLDVTWLDTEIRIATKDGDFGLPPMPVRVPFFVFGGFALTFWFLRWTFVGDGTFLQSLFFFILMMSFTLYLANYDKTRRMLFQSIPSAMNYLSKSNRKLETTRLDNAYGLINLIGIEMTDDGRFSVDKNGMVTFLDGRVGYFYRVVGNASILLFEQDECAILDRVDNFYRKIDPKVEYLFLSTKESQRSDKQQAHLEKLYKDYQLRGDNDPDLELLFKERYEVLKSFEYEHFNSIHHYMVIMAPNKELLRLSRQMVELEAASSGYFIRDLELLDKKDITGLIRMIYSGEVRL